MIKCGVTDEIKCEYRRSGNCENAQGPCPSDIVISLFEEGKSVNQISIITKYDESEIDNILRIAELIK